MNGPPPFDLRGARVVLGSRTVLHDVSLRLGPAELVFLLGDNGSGKTTLVKALLGLLPLEAGTLEVFSTPAARFRRWDRIGYVPQRPGASSGVPASVREVVLSGRAGKVGALRRYGPRDRELARRALEAVGLAALAGEPVANLSGGQQQRVLIARSLAGDPDVLVLDEPAAGIDAESQESLARTLAALREQGRSVLLVAHGLGPMRPLVDRTVVLASGRVVHDGPLSPPGGPPWAQDEAVFGHHHAFPEGA